jgi:amino acid transporter
MKMVTLVLLNAGLAMLFVLLLRKPGLLSYYREGRVWLTWLAVAVITLMDEFTSIFYVPAEAYRFIGASAIFYIAITSILIRFMSTRFTEIAEILEHHGLIGGGVYSFSYLVLGPVVSFIAISSIMVDYILTACISSVSAVLNAVSIFPLLHQSQPLVVSLVLLIIWAVAGLNILGIRESARFTFIIFVVVAFVMVNLVVSGLLALDQSSLTAVKVGIQDGLVPLKEGSWSRDYGNFISHVAFCILAYSGIESVIQTAGFVRNWREIRKAYHFLALTVGVLTPLVAALCLSASINFKQHEGDLVTHYASLVNGAPFGIVVAVLATLTLTMAVNTAFVASSELLERVAHRYGFRWLIAVNQRHSLYRIHLINASFFSVIILITHGSQTILADMYAIGLLASFCINMGALLVYRYFRGTGEVIPYHTSRLGTLVLFVVLLSCFLFLAVDKPHGTLLWAVVTTTVLSAGLMVARRRSPETKEIAQGETEMELVLYLAESNTPDVYLIFRRPREESLGRHRGNEAYITFYSPRLGIPPRLGPNHFRLPLRRGGLYQRIFALLKIMEYEFTDREVTVHIGWPMSSWLDRLAIGVMIFNLMRLPRLFPQFTFDLRYERKVGMPERSGAESRAHPT